MFFSSKKSLDIPQINTSYNYIDTTNTIDIDDINDIIKGEYIKVEEDIEDVNQAENVNVNENVNEDESVIEDVNEEDELCEDELCEDEDCLFIISIDGIPSYYEDKINNAKNRIDNVSKLYSLNDYGYHDIHIKYISDSEIDIIRNYDFWFFSINHVMHKFKIFKIIKC